MNIKRDENVFMNIVIEQSRVFWIKYFFIIKCSNINKKMHV